MRTYIFAFIVSIMLTIGGSQASARSILLYEEPTDYNKMISGTGFRVSDARQKVVKAYVKIRNYREPEASNGLSSTHYYLIYPHQTDHGTFNGRVFFQKNPQETGENGWIIYEESGQQVICEEWITHYSDWVEDVFGTKFILSQKKTPTGLCRFEVEEGLKSFSETGQEVVNLPVTRVFLTIDGV